MPAPPPDGPRPFLLRAVAHYDPATGLDGVVDRVDWAGASPRLVVHTVLGRPPRAAAEVASADTPRALAKGLLGSLAFRRRAVRLLLDAFPGKRRLFHVHVPKCAGTHLRARLARLHALLPANLGEPDLYSEAEFFTRLRDVLARVRDMETIVVSGHVALRHYLGQPTEPPDAGEPAWWCRDPPPFRFGDAMVTVIREPEAMAVSHANYVVGRLLDDPDQARADTRGWLRLLGREALPPDSPPAELVQVAREVLYNHAVTEPDRMCRLLGGPTADAALDALALCDIEISHLDLYPRWLEARFGVVAERRTNTSRPILVRETLSPSDREHLRNLTAQDRIVHDRVRHALARRDGALSVLGPEVAATPMPDRWLLG